MKYIIPSNISEQQMVGRKMTEETESNTFCVIIIFVLANESTWHI